MKLKYVFELAMKNIMKHRLRTFLTVGGVTIAIAFTIFLVSLGFGLQKIAVEEIVNLGAIRTLDVAIGKAKAGKINQKTLERFKKLQGVEKVFPQVSLGGKIGYKTSSIDGVIYGKNTGLLKLEEVDVTEGTTYSSNNVKQAIVNTTALKLLGFKDYEKSLGRTVTLDIAIPSNLAARAKGKAVHRKEKYKIIGVVEAKKAPYVYVPLDTLKKLGVANYNEARIEVKNQDKVEIIRKQIENMDFRVTTAKETLSQANLVFDILKLVLLTFGVIAVFVACIGMFNTLTISLLERMREIGMMRALGTTNRDVRRIFLAEALMIGFLGGLEGVILALLLGGMINLGIGVLAKMTGNKPATLFYSPFLLVLGIFFFAVFISFLTGFYPARRASRTNPLDALRYE